MNYREYGAANGQTILLLHGGGLGPWNYAQEAVPLKSRYHVVLPALDRHNGSDRDFATIEDNADEILAHMDEYHGIWVFLLGGLSLGGKSLLKYWRSVKTFASMPFWKVRWCCQYGQRTLVRPAFSL